LVRPGRQIAQRHRRASVTLPVDGDAGAARIGGDGQRRLGLDLEQLAEPLGGGGVDVGAGELALLHRVVHELLDDGGLHVEELERDRHRVLRAALLHGAVEQLVGAERLARLRHAGRQLAVAAEDHLDLDEVLALHRAHAARRRRALAKRVGELLRQRLGDVHRLETEDGDADIGRGTGARRSQDEADERRQGRRIAGHRRPLYTKDAVRLSISAKIFVGFLVVLATFGAVATYGAVTMRSLGDELRLVSRGYLDLQLEVRELYTAQTNLLREIELLSKEGPAKTRFVKPDLDAARRVRLMKLPKTLDDVRRLEELRSSAEEHALLNQVRTRLLRVESEYRADEELFDAAFGPIGDLSLLGGDPDRLRPARERLWRQEEAIRKHLSNLGVELKLRSEQASLRLEKEEDRAVWATLLLA